jgi:hypothetical protein
MIADSAANVATPGLFAAETAIMERRWQRRAAGR